jgi:hypothetical protein
MTNTKRLQTWINPVTHQQLSEFLQDDSNRILGAKIKKGGAVNLGLLLLFNARKTMTLDEIYQSCNGSSGDD